MKNRQVSTNIDVEIKSPLVKNIIIVFLCMLMVFFVIYPITVFTGDKNQLKTQTAISKTVYKTLDVEAFAVREEVLIDNSVSGTVIPVVKNGSKVAVGDTVANVYFDGNAAETAARLEELQSEIQYYSSIQSNSIGTLQTDISVYKNGVADALYALSDAVENNEMSNIYTLSRKFREALTKKQIVMGKQIDVSDTLTKLTAEYAAVKNSFTVKAGVTVQNAGYYVNAADGYESTVDFSTVKKLKFDDVNDILTATPKTVSSSNVGKLITDYNWYLVLNTEKSALGDIATGSEVTVTVANSAVGDIVMKVSAINVIDGSDKVTLILTSNLMNEDIAQLRNVSIKIRIKSYTGLSVDNRALRTVDGEKGVYIKVGNIIRFRKVGIVYTDENIILSQTPKDGSGYLEQYDEIILEGTQLYESKLLK